MPRTAPAIPADLLASVADHIRRWAAERKLPVVTGAVATADARTPPRITLAAAPPSDSVGGAPDEAALDALLAEVGAVAAAAGPAFVVLDVDRLEAADLEGALATLRDGDAPPEVVAQAEGSRGAVGHVAGVYVAVLTAAPAAMLTQGWTAPWHDVVFDPEAFVPECEDPVAVARAAADRAAARERATWTARKQTETARRLLADPAFAAARTEKASLVLLRDMLGDEAPENDALLREIAREAQAMYELRSAR
jgi:hypothetical protein